MFAHICVSVCVQQVAVALRVCSFARGTANQKMCWWENAQMSQPEFQFIEAFSRSKLDKNM